MHACMHACAHVCVCVCVRASAYVCVHYAAKHFVLLLTNGMQGPAKIFIIIITIINITITIITIIILVKSSP